MKLVPLSRTALVAGLGLVGVVALCSMALADTPVAPVSNKGDTAWMLTSSALVLMMSVPGLALFYGGLARTKNALSILTQVFAIVSMVGILMVPLRLFDLPGRYERPVRGLYRRPR